ncbi:hypothetical protein U9M48_037342 [Paspalum notatum var. saurae]|uniref:DUF1618 domain-containing protein n=1 Tax=Paspalum notatum var. saurae TaxID=547442 RepID=A0AAQ3UGW2_PASNO
MPWVILGRVVRGEPVPDAVGVQGAQQQQHAAVALDLNADPPEEAEDAAAAADEPDFVTAPVVLPPRVTILAAGRGAHPDANNRDRFPYIIAAGRFLLAHFAVAPFFGTTFDDNPQNTRLVLLRHFHTTAQGQITAAAEPVPGVPVPSIRNIQSVGLVSTCEPTVIAELQVDRAGDHFTSTLIRFQYGRWSRRDMECPLPDENGRPWVPHGAICVNSSICWFDLSWGMLSCDLHQPEEELFINYHPLPDDHMLPEATPDIHNRRCIAVTRNDTRLRYVEITPAAAGEAAPTVTMWTRFIRADGWEWVMNYTMSFDRIWDDDSYTAIGLPRDVVPVLSAVSPANHHVVYFALGQNIFSVNVPMHRVEQCGIYDLVNMPGPPRPASSRYLVTWKLPEEVDEVLGNNALAVPGQQLSLVAEEEAQEESDSEASEGVIEDEGQEVPDMGGGQLAPAGIYYDYQEPNKGLIQPPGDDAGQGDL